jgi:glycosyltransferase involved in cell wall biosynthesis
MKVLLSAFACEPHVGSEHAVGWNWAVSLQRAGHDVVVITRSQSRAAIERALAGVKEAPRFAYFDVAKAFRWQKRGPLHAHVILWQWLAAEFACTLHRREQFDRVHHVTYAGLRAPSFMGKLGIPFIFGPVGGGERAPWHLRLGYGPMCMAIEAARDAANLLVRLTPFMKSTFHQASHIYVTSPETLAIIPRRYRCKTHIELAIGIDGPGIEGVSEAGKASPTTARGGGLRVLYAGRFVDYKGMHVGLRGFARLAHKDPAARLTMVGEGPSKRRWLRLVQSLGVERQVDWVGWQSGASMQEVYARHDVLLFPALHDTGGMVALEAMCQGLPVVCLKLGGPAALVNESCGRVVDPEGKTVADIATELGDALLLLSDATVLRELSGGARARCKEFSWSRKVARLYGSPAS